MCRTFYDRWSARLCAVAFAWCVVNVGGTLHAAGPGVHGRVFALDESGELAGVVAGAQIEFKGPSGAITARATATDGYYKVDLPPGNYTYTVKATGYRDEDEGRGVQLQLSEGYATYNFSLIRGETDPDRPTPPKITPQPTGRLTGRVSEKTARGEAPGIPGAVIRWINQKEDSAEQVVVSRNTSPSQAGGYEIVLAAGTYQAIVTAEGFGPLVDPKPLVIEADQDHNRDFVLARRRDEPAPSDQGIKGIITVVGASAEGTADVKVTISAVRDGAAQTATEFHPETGQEYARSLSTGSYIVAAEADGFKRAASDPVAVYRNRYTQVDLTLARLEPALPAPPDVDLPPADKPGLIAKVWVYRQTEDDVTPEQRLPGASVSLRMPDGSARNATTNREGIATFENLPRPGDYQAVAQHEGLTGTEIVRVSQGGPNGAEIVLRRSGPAMPQPEPPKPEGGRLLRIEVVQQDERGQSTPVESADFAVAGPSGEHVPAKVSKDPSKPGWFTTHLPSGSYRVFAERDGYPPASATVVIADQDTSCRLVFRRHSGPGPHKPETPQPGGGRLLRIEVVQQDERGQSTPVQSADFTVGGLQGEHVHAKVSSEPGKPGWFTTRLPSGSYRVFAEKDGYPPASATVVIADQDTSCRLVFRRHSGPGPHKPETPQPGGARLLRIEVVQQDERGQSTPVQSADFAVGGLQGKHVHAKVSSEPGKPGWFTTRLPSGSYRVFAEKEGYPPASATVVIADQDTSCRLVFRRHGEGVPPGPTSPKPQVPPQPPKGRATLQVQVLAGGQPVSDAVVELHFGPQGTRQHRIVDRRETQGNHGIAVFHEVPRASYWILARDGQQTGQAGVPKQWNPLQPIPVRLPRGKESPPPPPPPGATLVVHVQGRDLNAPIGILHDLSQAQVAAIHADGRHWSGKTDGAGRWRVKLPPGQYRVEARFPTAVQAASAKATIGKQGIVEQLLVVKYRTPE